MYSARITRINPTAIIILIDQSTSMKERTYFYGLSTTKAEAVILAANMLITEVIYRCCREFGVADYFDIGAFGYHSSTVEPLIIPNKTFVKPSLLTSLQRKKQKITRERQLPNGETVVVTTEVTRWIEQARAEGATPMHKALSEIHKLAAKWCKKECNASSFPPIIFHITDGEASDSDAAGLLDVSEKIKSLKTADGNALFINIDISNNSSATTNNNTIFPSSKKELPDSKHAKLLYDMSSEMPDIYNHNISKVRRTEGNPPYRGMSYNCSITDMLSMINIGSITLKII